MTFILPSFGASAIAAVPGGGGGFSNDYSVDFDGTDEYLATTYQYGSATQFTYSFWIKTTDTGNSHWVGNSFTGGYDSRCHFGTKGGLYYFLLGNSSNYYQVQQGSASAVTDGNWHHMVFQWDGTNTNGVKLYVDGNTTPVFTYTSTVASNASAAPLMWGIGWGSSFYAYDGLMDEAALFESILSTSQITNIYRGEDDGGSGGTNGVPGDLDTFNPVGWWRMGDSDSGVSNGSSTPTIVSNVASLQNNYALDFDGSNETVTVPNIATYFTNNATAVTISAWIKLDTTSDGGYEIARFTSNVGIYFNAYKSGGTYSSITCGYHDGGNYNQIICTTDIFDGNWHHVAYTYDQPTNVIKGYIDGSLETAANTQTSGTPTWETFTSFNIGSTSVGTNPFNGLIDEVAVWPSVLSASNIASLYNSGAPADLGSSGLNLNPTAWWRMGDGGTWDGSNWSIPDASANSYTGTTTNMVEADRVTDVPTANGNLINGPTYSDNVPT